MECTDWNVFTDACGDDLDSLTVTVSDYINFCLDTVIPEQKVKVFAHNKPWITSDIKEVLNRKKRAFASGNRDDLKAVQKEFKAVLRKGKEEYKRKLEFKLECNSVKDVWKDTCVCVCVYVSECVCLCMWVCKYVSV